MTEVEALARLDALVEGMGDRYRPDEPLARRCTLRVGGAARRWFEPQDEAELINLLEIADALAWPVALVGLGSNALFPDEGLDGAVIRLSGELAGLDVQPDAGDDTRARVVVGGGAINAHVVRGLRREGWVGAEFLALIPGTLGGAVAMNAGTREQEVASILHSARLAWPDDSGRWRVEVFEAARLSLSYRHAELPPRAIVLAATLDVRAGDAEAAAALVRADKERRERTQPYRLASVGSTFANPPGDAAGRLIEAAGLKGAAVGGARISTLHANFFINEGEATAHDFLSIMALARVRVRRAFGVELRPEVCFVGFDGWARLRALEQELEDQDV